MFHLFAGVQLIPDLLSITCNREYVISKFEDYTFNQDKETINLIINQPYTIIQQVKTYDELVGQYKVFKTDVDFFEDIYRHANENTSVYADIDAYAIILCKMLKLTLPSISSELAYTLYKLSLDKFYVKYCYTRDIIKSSLWLVNPKDFIGQMKRLSKEEFIALFEKTGVTGDATSFLEKIKQETSTEYQIASLLLGSTEFDDNLQYQLKNVAVSHVFGMVQELQYLVLFNLYQFEGNDVLTDFHKAIANGEIADLLIDTELIKFQKVKDFSTIIDTCQRVVDYFKEHVNDLRWDGLAKVTAEIYTNFQWLLDILKNDQSAKEILDVMLKTREQYYGDLLYSYSSKDNINMFLLFYVYQLYQEKDFDTLKQLSFVK